MRELALETRTLHEIPPELLVAADYAFEPGDELRMYSLGDGDAVGDYFGYPEAQQYLIAQDRARMRLNLDQFPDNIAFEPAVVATHAAAYRLREVMTPSALCLADKLSNTLGNDVFLKLENNRPPTYTFKDRGAYNKIASLTAEERACGILAVSTGNHAQGVALAARRFGIPAMIVMPVTTPEVKQRAVKEFGAEIVLAGQNYTDAYVEAMLLQAKADQPMTFVHPFNDPAVTTGQGTVGKEMIEQQPNLTHIFVPIGGGGLIGGIGQYVKKVRPDIQIVGVEPHDSNCASVARQAGRPVALDHVGGFADSLTVKQMGDLTYELLDRYVDDVITVSIAEIRSAMGAVAKDTRTIVEPSGAVGLAGLVQHAQRHNLQNARMATICSGGNVDLGRFFQLVSKVA